MKNTAEVCLAAGGAKHPKSNFMLMEKLDTGKQAVPLADAVVRLIRESGLPVGSITTDNGPEFAAPEIIARELNTKVYFAHPYCSWEKGAIENMNGLIRQYIPKKTDFRGIKERIALLCTCFWNLPCEGKSLNCVNLQDFYVEGLCFITYNTYLCQGFSWY